MKAVTIGKTVYILNRYGTVSKVPASGKRGVRDLVRVPSTEAATVLRRVTKAGAIVKTRNRGRIVYYDFAKVPSELAAS